MRWEKVVFGAVLMVALSACRGGRKEGSATELVSIRGGSPFGDVQAKYPNEPAGFRSLIWGTTLDASKGMRAGIRDNESGLVWCASADERLLLKDIRLRGVVYGFSGRRGLVAGKLTFDGQDYTKLNDYLTSVYGPATSSNGPGSKIKKWEGDVTLIKLYAEKLVLVHQPFLTHYSNSGRGYPNFLSDIY